MENVIENIKSRRSIRKYKADQINDEALNTILEAARYAPSGSNSQTWHFTVIQNRAVLSKLNQYIKAAFEKIEIHESTYRSIKAGKIASKNAAYNFYYNAPTLIIVSNEADYANAMADSACSIENMLLAANYLELGACYINQLTWFGNDESIKEFLVGLGVPENHKVCGSVCVGYGDGPNSSNKLLKENTVTIIK